VLNFVGGEFVEALLLLAFVYLHELLALAARRLRCATASSLTDAAAVGIVSSVPALKARWSLDPHDEVAGAALVHNLAAANRLHLSIGANSNDSTSTLYKV